MALPAQAFSERLAKGAGPGYPRPVPRLFESLFRGSGDTRQKDALIDLLLMAAMADGVISQADLDRVARAIETESALSGVDWDRVRERVPAIEDDAPLFSETRARVAAQLKSKELQALGLELAAQFLGEPLEEEEKALLRSLAEGFQLDHETTEDLIVPWRKVDPLQSGYRRCRFNDPEGSPQLTLFQAVSDATDDEELALLTFKLAAARAAMTALSESAELVSVGESIELGDEVFRVDALIRVAGQSFIARFLDEDEAMYPKEHALMPRVLEHMDSSASIYIGYAGALAPPDEGALQLLDATRVRSQKLEL